MYRKKTKLVNVNGYEKFSNIFRLHLTSFSSRVIINITKNSGDIMTITKLAEMTGYSVSTVSKALANKKDVSEYAKQKIIEKAKELGCYEKFCRENYDRKIIAVLCPEVKSQFYSKILSTLNQQIEERGGTMAISMTDFSKTSTEKLFRLYSGNKRADGIILFGNGNLVKKHCPVPVVVFGENQTPYADTVYMNSQTGFNEALALLKNYGHKRIGFIGEKLTELKQDHFLKAVKSVGLEVDSDLIYVSSSRFEEAGFEGAERLLSKDKKPTAIVCAYDNIALGAITYAERKGLSVPKDLSVIGCDNMQISSHTKISLSTIDLNVFESCITAVDLLFNKISKSGYCINKSISILSSYIDRKTVTFAKDS